MSEGPTTQVTAALQAFMQGLIDYAGLFPPASLPLEEALANYTRYREEPEAWMLSRFIIPAGRLQALTADQLSQGAPFDFSVLGRGGQTRAEFLTTLEEDTGTVAAFVAAHSGRATAGMLEVRLPVELLKQHDAAAVQTLLAEAGQILGDIRPFYEVAFVAGWEQMVETAVTALGAYGWAGFKLRCGGVEAGQFPSIEQVAFALENCRRAAVPLKCTAGLHHPVRHASDAVGTKMHGFINVFGAGLLNYATSLNLADLKAILAEENPAQFAFSEAAFAWRDLEASVEEIEKIRAEMLVSYGSCSFDEPREDLQALGWLG